MGGVLLDVGGTLWSDGGWDFTGFDRDEFVAGKVREAFPGWASELLQQVARLPLPKFQPGDAQDVDAAIARYLRRMGLELSPTEVLSLRRALSVPAFGRAELFEGVAELLKALKAWDHRVVLISNGTVRDSYLYFEDLADFGLAPYVDDVVTSVDVGYLKPHPEIFAAAARAVGWSAGQCAMVGNSEKNDIAPAKERGMFAVRVCIEEPAAEVSAADAVVTSLAAAKDVLDLWSRRLLGS